MIQETMVPIVIQHASIRFQAWRTKRCSIPLVERTGGILPDFATP
jgi:hypothetical protein